MQEESELELFPRDVPSELRNLPAGEEVMVVITLLNSELSTRGLT